MKLLRLKGGLEITSIADIPSRGTGWVVQFLYGGLAARAHASSGRYASAERLAQEACEIEIERCKEPIGKQDQYAAAYGGLNFIQFHPDDLVSVDPIVCRRETLQRLQDNIVVFYTGISRNASDILKHSSGGGRGARQTGHAQEDGATGARPSHRIAEEQSGCLRRDHPRQLETQARPERGISTGPIDRWYAAARRAGAIGGKLLGAGSGRFLMFYGPRDRHDAIARGLKGLRRADLGFEPQGSKIISCMTNGSFLFE